MVSFNPNTIIILFAHLFIFFIFQSTTCQNNKWLRRPWRTRSTWTFYSIVYTIRFTGRAPSWVSCTIIQNRKYASTNVNFNEFKWLSLVYEFTTSRFRGNTKRIQIHKGFTRIKLVTCVQKKSLYPTNIILCYDVCFEIFNEDYCCQLAKYYIFYLIWNLFCSKHCPLIILF